MGLRKVFNFKNIFFATLAKNLCAFAVKKLLRQPQQTKNCCLELYSILLICKPYGLLLIQNSGK